jgi:phenylacetate-CoA ligase
LEELINRLKKSPLYQKKLKPMDWESLASGELMGIPLTTKEDLIQAGPYGLLAADIKDIGMYFETSGTNGKPSTSWFTHQDLETGGRQIGRTAEGMLPSDLVVNRFPYALSLPAHLVQSAARLAGAGVVPMSGRTPMTPYPKVLELLVKLQGSLLIGLPREMELLAEVATMMGLDFQRDIPALRGIWVAGEMLVDERRKHMESLWGVPVYNMYGSTETANISTMCEYGSMHIAEEDFLIEILQDDLGEYVSAGNKGRAVITTLSHQGSPVIRYLNGDILSIHNEPCPCGRSERILKHYGRYEDRSPIGAKLHDPYSIHQAIFSLPNIPLAWTAYRREESIHFEVEFQKDTTSGELECREWLCHKLQGSVSVEIKKHGMLLDREQLMDYPVSTKPKYIQ